MITILTSVDVRPGMEKRFEALWRQVRPEMAHYAGLRMGRLLRDTDEPGRYVFYSEWDDRAQFDAFVRASGMLWLLDATDEWITPHHWSYMEDVAEAGPTD
jgi:heme-degrading monooxygenase HmoA